MKSMWLHFTQTAIESLKRELTDRMKALALLKVRSFFMLTIVSYLHLCVAICMKA